MYVIVTLLMICTWNEIAVTQGTHAFSAWLKWHFLFEDSFLFIGKADFTRGGETKRGIFYPRAT